MHEKLVKEREVKLVNVYKYESHIESPSLSELTPITFDMEQ